MTADKEGEGEARSEMRVWTRRERIVGVVRCQVERESQCHSEGWGEVRSEEPCFSPSQLV